MVIVASVSCIYGLEVPLIIRTWSFPAAGMEKDRDDDKKADRDPV